MPTFLTNRFLKLPVWAWILILGTGVGIILRMRNASGEGSSVDGEDTSATPGDVTGGPTYGDPSGFSGFPAYANPINTQTDGIAATDPYQNILPDLAGVLQGQQDLIAGLVGQQGAPGVQCGAGTVWDDTKGKCVAIPVTNKPPVTTTPKPAAAKVRFPTAKRCASGTRWDYYRGVCTKCGGGQTYNARTGHCGPCPTGYRC